MDLKNDFNLMTCSCIVERQLDIAVTALIPFFIHEVVATWKSINQHLWCSVKLKSSACTDVVTLYR